MTQDAIENAHKIYTGLPDWLYHVIVYQINSPFAWGVNVKDIDTFYQKNISKYHLEVGLASSRFILKNALPDQKITLLDINRFSLDKAVKKLGDRYKILTIEANVLKPIQSVQRHDSIALNYVLHCLPGELRAEGKGICFRHLSNLLNDGGKLFGATILGKGVQHNRFGKLLMKKFNAKGIFNNKNDSLDGLRQALEAVFPSVDIKLKGRIAFFTASR
jgi:hypothetical protein